MRVELDDAKGTATRRVVAGSSGFGVETNTEIHKRVLWSLNRRRFSPEFPDQRLQTRA